MWVPLYIFSMYLQHGAECYLSSPCTYDRGQNGDAIEAKTGHNATGVSSRVCSNGGTITYLFSIQQSSMRLKIMNQFLHG